MTDRERIARLESRVAAHDELLPRMDAKLDRIESHQSKQSGFIAGVLFILTPVALGVAWLLKTLWNAVTGT